MIDPNGGPFTAHTTNPVHLILVGDERRGADLRSGIFADVAPTILAMLGLQAPAEMTGTSLLEA
jgi:2,3-bisphosphoglycerate-independent phosphoglycerate mutase